MIIRVFYYGRKYWECPYTIEKVKELTEKMERNPHYIEQITIMRE